MRTSYVQHTPPLYESNATQSHSPRSTANMRLIMDLQNFTQAIQSSRGNYICILTQQPRGLCQLVALACNLLLKISKKLLTNSANILRQSCRGNFPWILINFIVTCQNCIVTCDNNLTCVLRVCFTVLDLHRCFHVDVYFVQALICIEKTINTTFYLLRIFLYCCPNMFCGAIDCIIMTSFINQLYILCKSRLIVCYIFCLCMVMCFEVRIIAYQVCFRSRPSFWRSTAVVMSHFAARTLTDFLAKAPLLDRDSNLVCRYCIMAVFINKSSERCVLLEYNLWSKVSCQ